jgi:3-isopropylmalate/(R)-2-methylmalate dehydratase small subunit
MSQPLHGIGRAFVLGDNIDTDAMAPGRLMKFPLEQILPHVLEGVAPAFARTVRAGDVIVAGRNFGVGSSREQAPQALKALGIACLIAPSYAGLFYRNAINLGLPALVCREVITVQEGDQLAWNAQTGRLENRTQGGSWACDPVPDFLCQMLAVGGLLPTLAQRMQHGAAHSAQQEAR